MDIENQKSVISRFEQKERDVEKLVQANENELKLTRSDAEEKQRLVEELRTQLKELNQQVNTINQAQEMTRGLTTFFLLISLDNETNNFSLLQTSSSQNWRS